MISVAEAEAIVLAHLYKSKIERVPLHDTYGKRLAEPLHADADLPPFDRVMMDGIAVRFSSLQAGQFRFRLVGVQGAGEAPHTLQKDDEALECMTGAICPQGADVVVPYEDLEIEGNEATVRLAPKEVWKNIHRQGRDARKGEILVKAGSTMRSAEIGIAASVGKTEVAVCSDPSIALVSTGNELVEVTETPLPWQIRRSNVHALRAALRGLQLSATLFHCNDDPTSIHHLLTSLQGKFDVVILSGGVSKGKFDYIPTVLESLGVQCHFHRVLQKPGKPIYFGTSAEQTFFALPGNPVSTLVCFHRYFVPWWRKINGVSAFPETVLLHEPPKAQHKLTLFTTVRIETNADGERWAFPVPGQGSGDFSHLHLADGFVQLDPTEVEIKKGSRVPYFPLL